MTPRSAAIGQHASGKPRPSVPLVTPRLEGGMASSRRSHLSCGTSEKWNIGWEYLSTWVAKRLDPDARMAPVSQHDRASRPVLEIAVTIAALRGRLLSVIGSQDRNSSRGNPAAVRNRR